MFNLFSYQLLAQSNFQVFCLGLPQKKLRLFMGLLFSENTGLQIVLSLEKQFYQNQWSCSWQNSFSKR